MVPGILSLADIAADDYKPDFYEKDNPSFKPIASVPWLVSLPFPVIAGWLGTKFVGPVTSATPVNSMRIRNAVGGLIMGVPAFFSFRVALDEEIFMGVRIAGGVTGTFFGLSAILMLYNAVRPLEARAQLRRRR